MAKHKRRRRRSSARRTHRRMRRTGMHGLAGLAGLKRLKLRKGASVRTVTFGKTVFLCRLIRVTRLKRRTNAVVCRKASADARANRPRKLRGKRAWKTTRVASFVDKKLCIVKSGPKKGRLRKGFRFTKNGRCLRVTLKKVRKAA